MKIVKIIFIGLMLIGWTAQSSATPVELTDTIMFTPSAAVDQDDFSNDLDSYGWGDVNKLDWPSIVPLKFDHVSWTHDYIFAPPYATLLDATLTVWLRDDGGFLDLWEVAVGWTEDGTWDWGEVDVGNYSYAVSLAAVADGAFSVTVKSLFGDFYIDKSELKINYEPQEVTPQQVSEPAIFLLFSVLTLVLLKLRRR